MEGSTCKEHSSELKSSISAVQQSPSVSPIRNTVRQPCVCFLGWVLREEEPVAPSSSSRGNVTDRPAELFTGWKSNLSLNLVLDF